MFNSLHYTNSNYNRVSGKQLKRTEIKKYNIVLLYKTLFTLFNPLTPNQNSIRYFYSINYWHVSR